MLVFERHISCLFLCFRAGASLYTELSCCALLHKVLTALAYMHEQVLNAFCSPSFHRASAAVCFEHVNNNTHFLGCLSSRLEA
jgi:hypothetical protein